ncbi:MAG: GNAT family N-acetyltransferase [Acidobacteriota bacterium]|nr:GNAT family N-acetyltransferase [Acidobacteriota bacterium]
MIQEVVEGEHWPAAYALMRQLRRALSQTDFTARYREAHRRDDYRLYGVFEDGQCVALLGIRRLVDFLHGPHLYIDDLVVADGARSRGLGATLLAFAERLSSDAGSAGLRLCTGIDYQPARRFYDREGWKALAVAYKKGFA